MAVNFPLVPIDPQTPAGQRRMFHLLGAIINSLARQGKLVMSGNEFVLNIPGTPAGIRYRFSTTTADADPGPGRLRLNQAVQNTATVVRLDDLDVAGTSWAPIVSTWDDSTSTVKGYLTITGEANPAHVLAFSNGNVANPGGYKNVTVANLVSSAASPFADGDYVWVSWQRAGDDGTSGSGSGTVTSVDIDTTATANILDHSGAAITASGIFTFSLTAHGSNAIVAYPANGSSGVPTARAMIEADMPATTGFTDVAKTWTAAQSFANAGFRIRDAAAGFYLRIQPGSVLVGDSVFTITTGPGSRTLDISAADIAPTAFAATYLDDADAASFRITVGLQIGVNVQAYDATLAALAAYNTNGIVCQTAADTFAGRTLTQPAAGITVSNGDGVGGNPTLALADDLAALEALAGTDTIYRRSGASAWSAVTIGGLLSFSAGTLNVGDAELVALAGLTSAADKLPYFTGSGTAALADFTSTARSLVDDTSTSAMRTTLGLAIGTNVQAWDADLDDIAALAPADGDILKFASGHWTKVTPTSQTVVTGITGGSISGCTVTITYTTASVKVIP